MKIIIETIPHSEQRYPTAGDWQFEEDGTLHIRVSEMSDPRYEFLVGMHEAHEAFLAHLAGVSEADVDAFDMKYEDDRDAGLHGPDEEPGMDPACPVYRQHRFADAIERLTALEAGVDWSSYEEEIETL